MMTPTREAISQLGINKPAPPNYFLWLAKEKITAQEAAALYVGRDPRHFQVAALSREWRDRYDRFTLTANDNDKRPLLSWLIGAKELEHPPHIRDILTAFEANNARQDRWTTPYLRLIEQAVEKFFGAGRTRDPKSPEVVDWLSKKMEEAGVPPSKHIASAIFTIIKAPDHNPRKKSD